ncbi:MAG: hypothetical protein U9N33_11365 [Campylobacterota bacterium]|nr:hypothetical protein [Campylobacterota bacterium]
MQNLSLTSSFLLFFTSSLFGASLGSTPTDSSLIVYNGGIGLVHEQRELTLNKGDKQIVYKDVASTIETDSVNTMLPASVTLYSQQYRFDKLTISKLLDAHVGSDIKVADKTLTLLSHNGDKALVRDKNGEIISILSKEIIFKAIPDSLITKPSLVWNIKATKDLTTKIDIDYLINNLSWKSDYILNITKNKANLSGWITIENRSGKAYKNTNLHVLAGDINRANKQNPAPRYLKSMASMADAPAVSHKAHEGYHFYSIPFKVNLANNEKTQIKFINENSIPITRKYSSTMSNPDYLHSEIKHSVTQHVEIQKLAFALPKGVVRSYSKLGDNNILLGESSLKHTPKDTLITLTLGKNFDIKVKETIQSRSDTQRYFDSTVLYTLENSSNEQKNVEILIPFNKNSTSSIDTKKAFKYKNGNMLSFKTELNTQEKQIFKVRFRSKR